MRDVDAFMEQAAQNFRRRLALLGDGGERRALEDSIILLTDYRVSGMDETGLKRLLATMQAGRSPVGLAVLKPQTIAVELTRRWREHVEGRAVAALN